MPVYEWYRALVYRIGYIGLCPMSIWTLMQHCAADHPTFFMCGHFCWKARRPNLTYMWTRGRSIKIDGNRVHSRHFPSIIVRMQHCMLLWSRAFAKWFDDAPCALCRNCGPSCICCDAPNNIQHQLFAKAAAIARWIGSHLYGFLHYGRGEFVRGLYESIIVVVCLWLYTSFMLGASLMHISHRQNRITMYFSVCIQFPWGNKSE